MFYHELRQWQQNVLVVIFYMFYKKPVSFKNTLDEAVKIINFIKSCQDLLYTSFKCSVNDKRGSTHTKHYNA